MAKAKPPGSVVAQRYGYAAKWQYRDPAGKLRNRSRQFPTEAAAWQFLRQVDGDRQRLHGDVARQVRRHEASREFSQAAKFLDGDVLLMDGALAELPADLAEALGSPVDGQQAAFVIQKFAAVCSQLRTMLRQGIWAKMLLADAALEADDRVAEALEGLVAKSLRDCGDLNSPHVYCLWGTDPSRPLYVGKSTNVLPRLGHHFGFKDRAAAVTRVSLVGCPTVEAMDRTEQRLIRRYQPPWNILGVMPTEEN